MEASTEVVVEDSSTAAPAPTRALKEPSAKKPAQKLKATGRTGTKASHAERVESVLSELNELNELLDEHEAELADYRKKFESMRNLMG